MVRTALLVLLRQSWWLSRLLNHPPCRSSQNCGLNTASIPSLSWITGWGPRGYSDNHDKGSRPLSSLHSHCSVSDLQWVQFFLWSLWAAQYRSWTVRKLPYIFSMADRCVGGIFFFFCLRSLQLDDSPAQALMTPTLHCCFLLCSYTGCPAGKLRGNLQREDVWAKGDLQWTEKAMTGASSSFNMIRNPLGECVSHIYCILGSIFLWHAEIWESETLLRLCWKLFVSVFPSWSQRL